MKTAASARLALLLLLVLGAAKALLAQTPSYLRYTTADGLPTNYVYGVIEDVDGALWAYTENGLAKFDGYSFLHYNTDDGLPGNDIPWALRAADGKIWLFTYQNRPAYLWKDSIVITREKQGALKGLSPTGKPSYSFSDGSYYYDNGWVQIHQNEITTTELARFGKEWRLVHRLKGNKRSDIPPGSVGKHDWYSIGKDSVSIWSTIPKSGPLRYFFLLLAE